MRVLLDAHPWINCGAEPMIIYDILRERDEMIRLHLERVKKANIYPTALNKATAAYIFEMAINMVSEAKIYCQKQPWIFIYLDFLSTMFPQAKFVHMLRDGRAAVASTIE
ncbi:protein-tyrosine sulfotransferase [Paragonimus westermani]|uniref:Protein-tyrosine sulfotransferase n=1 Tax=Paragonimus westermani TaxID=34504 RepID=A0A5J4NEB6_9TREM|nr:protein-tyrosine sulfotransferase [Paragonimus westermani]